MPRTSRRVTSENSPPADMVKPKAKAKTKAASKKPAARGSSRAEAAAAAEDVDVDVDVDDVEEEVAPRARSKRGKKAAAAEEEGGGSAADEAAAAAKALLDAGAAPAPRRSRRNLSDREMKDSSVMDGSGQTQKERAKLRKNQRLLFDQIDDSAVALAKPGDKTIDELASKNNELFLTVAYNREAVTDIQNVALIAKHARARATAIGSTSSAYDAADVVRHLQRRLQDDDTGHFNWASLGRSVGVCFDKIPNTHFFNGAIDQPPKEKVVRQKRVRDEEEANYVEVKVVSDENDKKEEEVNAKRRKVLVKVQAAMQKEEGRKANVVAQKAKVNVLDMLVNPTSFTQTVENIFDFSFLVKDGRASMLVDDRGLPMTTMTRPLEVAQAPRQAVVAFTMADFKALTAAFDIEDTSIPHRQDPCYARTADENARAAAAKIDGFGGKGARAAAEQKGAGAGAGAAASASASAAAAAAPPARSSRKRK
jgi:hypothetical protein